MTNQLVVVPRSGLFVVRAANKEYGIVGVLHFPADFAISECAAYLCMVVDGRLQILRDPVDHRTYSDDWSGYGVGGLLRSQAWFATSASYTFTARFYQAFPESNGWVFIAASNQPVAPDICFGTSGHAWLSVLDGAIHGAGDAHDAVATGELYVGLLRLPIWPDAHGVPHTLPTIESGFRHAYTRVSELRAQAYLGEITTKEVHAIIAADKLLTRAASCGTESQYHRFLAVLYKRGLLTDEDPLSREETEQREAQVHSAFEESLLDSDLE